VARDCAALSGQPLLHCRPGGGVPDIWEFAPVDFLGYLGIPWDMKGYERISLEIQDIIRHHILKMISQKISQHILKYPIDIQP
jgi:hypothetical protein